MRADTLPQLHFSSYKNHHSLLSHYLLPYSNPMMRSSRAYNSCNWREKDQSLFCGPQQERKFRDESRRTRRKRNQEESPRALADGARIYVGNMPYIAQQVDVENLFAENGFKVVNIDMSIDPFTNRNPSYCFVDLASSEAATIAMETLNSKTLLGRPLKVRPCVQKRRRPGTSHPMSTDLISTRWHSNKPSMKQVNPDNVKENELSDTSATDLLLPLRERRRLYVGGLPKPLDQHTSDLELRELFDDFDVQAVSKVKSPLETKSINCGNSWYAFVDLSTAEEAQRAMRRLDGVRKWGGRLRVNIAKRIPGKVFERSLWDSEEELVGAIRGTSHGGDDF